jgi:hypothetical protein
VIRNLLMGLSVVSHGHEKALREEGPERPIGRSVPARQRSAPSRRRGWRIREKAVRIAVDMPRNIGAGRCFVNCLAGTGKGVLRIVLQENSHGSVVCTSEAKN